MCKKTTPRCPNIYLRQLAHVSRTCPKCLFLSIKQRTERSDATPPFLLHENSDMPAGSCLAKAEPLSNYLKEIYSARIVNETCHNHNTDTIFKTCTFD